MNIVDVWRNVSERIGFYTKETRHDIPDAPGIYAWLVPLWIYDEKNLENYIKIINGIFFYDPQNKARPSREVNVKFNWDSVRVCMEKHPRSPLTEDLQESWQKVMQDEKAKEIFAQALMEASLLMPPLYVGKTDSLSTRYLQHTKGSSREAGDFHSRFTSFSKELKLPLNVDDLLFVAIRTDSPTNQIFREYNLNKLLERLVMFFSCPPFSMR